MDNFVKGNFVVVDIFVMGNFVVEENFVMGNFVDKENWVINPDIDSSFSFGIDFNFVMPRWDSKQVY